MEIMKELDINTAIVSTQVSSRSEEYVILSVLAGIAASFAKFASDVRILQSQSIGEWSEAFEEKQVGSSAMPFKRNPINSEKICSLARIIAVLPNIALENVSHSYLERTLDDSANRRVINAEAFLALDEIIITAERVLTGLIINTEKITQNLFTYAPFTASEEILMWIVKKGGNRQEAHEVLRKIAMQARKTSGQYDGNQMQELLMESKEIRRYLTEKEIEDILHIDSYIGTAPERAMRIVEKIKKEIE
jgi:adenylosuccinate lyase